MSPPPSDSLEQELDALYERLYRPGDRLFGLCTRALPAPRFAMHYREADGEWYVYVEDRVGRRWAGYTVFNRLIEVNRRADAHVRAPHSKYSPIYQRRGLAAAVYGSALETGICLVSGARQSPGRMRCGSHWRVGMPGAMWRCVTSKLIYLGCDVPTREREDLPVRMFMPGQGWDLGAFAAAVRMQDGRHGSAPFYGA